VNERATCMRGAPTGPGGFVNDTMGGKSPIGCHVAEVILCDM
jgi:hypothetical protein